MNNNKSNQNNGLSTPTWGPATWISLHSISFGYPLNPDEETKKKYKQYFISVGDVLPCKYCRESYKEFINTYPKLTDEVMKSRETLTNWLYLLHERVNQKLGVNYGVTYNDVVEKYESFRAVCSPNLNKCVMPPDKKAESYKKLYYMECTIIPYEMAKAFSEYAKKRNITDFDESIKKYNDMQVNKKCEEWHERNAMCQNMIRNMKLNGISAIERSGEFEKLPSIEELQLIAKLSSNLGKDDLDQMIKLLNSGILEQNKNIDSKLSQIVMTGGNKIKKYKLISNKK